ncbi:cation:proton antiporter domain-containing protein [Streptomyces turgidiscabies]|uniref:Kef-type K+ transport system membrane component KefB n=1 Tax=Streptomyces turgidiscabies TaxID=85558 RepID=A0ABU0RZ45_9ACTN|nr:cation:proton antiporter [Streptomyces turgidiscabies]MDQ0937231.1 Kef-type K+ transport system membrane component KefB [Streptomyces turgidiscabies]
MELSTAAMLLSDLAVIVGVARVLGALARRLRQPAVIGEILGGILLGPTLFDGEITSFLFPADVRPSLTTLANVGVCVFMFLVGLEFNRGLLRGQGRIAVSVSLSAVVLPFTLGALLALHLVAHHPTGDRLAFVLFLGTAMSVTAFPVLARILTDKGLIDTPIGGLALAAAAVDDVLAWSMLAAVTALAGAGGAPWQILLVLPYAAALVWIVRPLLARGARRAATAGRPAGRLTARLTDAGVLLAVAAGLLLSARATEWMGLHLIFGAFLFGIVMPREGASRLRRHAVPLVERLCSVLLLPVFFMVAGLKVDLSSMDATAFGELGLILLVAIGGKFVGAFVGARLNGVRPRHSTVLAVLINTRGLTELIVLTVGLQIGVLDQPLYSLMVVMALVTTAMAGVLLPFVYPDERIHQDLAARDRAATSGGDASALSEK